MNWRKRKLKVNDSELIKFGKQKLEYKVWHEQLNALDKTASLANQFEKQLDVLHNNATDILDYLSCIILEKDLTLSIPRIKDHEDLENMQKEIESKMMDLEKTVFDLKKAYKQVLETRKDIMQEYEDHEF